MYVADTGTIIGQPERSVSPILPWCWLGWLARCDQGYGGRGAGVAVVPFCNIKAAGGTIILIVPETNCAGRLVSADLVLVSLVE